MEKNRFIFMLQVEIMSSNFFSPFTSLTQSSVCCNSMFYSYLLLYKLLDKVLQVDAWIMDLDPIFHIIASQRGETDIDPGHDKICLGLLQGLCLSLFM